MYDAGTIMAATLICCMFTYIFASFLFQRLNQARRRNGR
jgi:hypothetical protein